MDETLKWNPSDYNNITFLTISDTIIWTPGTFLKTQTFDMNYFFKMNK